MISRRRFLAISAAAVAAPSVQAETWDGQALGADAKITLYGSQANSQTAFEDIQTLINDVDAAFSLYDRDSELSRLNRHGQLLPSPIFRKLFVRSGLLHRATEGLFDPTVQPLWRAHLSGGDVRAAKRAVGWRRIAEGSDTIRLVPEQELTFNGIAQGYATDLVAEYLRAAGFGRVLVNIGEFAGFGEAWRVGIADPHHGLLGYRTLKDGAIATSSPDALMLPASGHIFHPNGGEPIWSTVSVEATSATLADGLSTALCLAPEDDIRRIRSRLAGVGRITLVDAKGTLTTL